MEFVLDSPILYLENGLLTLDISGLYVLQNGNFSFKMKNLKWIL
jgi:hypothetical protein